MTATRRLYWTDSLLLSFEAPVEQVATWKGRPALVFPETAFYPEVGGQLADRGVASWDGGSAPVADAQEDAEGRVLHVLDLPAGTAPPAAGARVRVTVDEARRRDHMSQHTGQHMLSRALLDVAGAATVSSRLGESVCTIDTPLASLSDDALAEAELRVAAAVLEDRPVRALHPSPEELARLPLRRDPKVSENVRVIEVEGFDFSPCGGTHCSRTGQVGPVHVTAVERHKGGTRIHFLAGMRAVRDYLARDRVLAGLARDLTCGWNEVPGVVAGLRESVSEARRAADRWRDRVAAQTADALLASARALGAPPLRVVATSLAGEPPELARAVAARICEAPDAVVALWVPAADGVSLFVQRGAQATRFDAGAALRRVAASCGGRGGGRPERAEGKLPAGADPAPAWEQEWRALSA